MIISLLAMISGFYDQLGVRMERMSELYTILEPALVTL